MGKWFQELLTNSPELAVGVLLMAALLFIIVVFMFSNKAAKAHFESITLDKIKEIEKDILSRFAGYENKLLLALDDVKNQVDFKKSKFLILNDTKQKVQRILNLCEIKNTTTTFKADDIAQYSAVIINLNNDNELEELKNQIEQIPTDIVKVIYHQGNNLNRNLLPKNNVIVNFEYTLIEKLHSIYLVKKIMEK
jgi:hypothetical protein